MRKLQARSESRSGMTGRLSDAEAGGKPKNVGESSSNARSVGQRFLAMPTLLVCRRRLSEPACYKKSLLDTRRASAMHLLHNEPSCRETEMRTTTLHSRCSIATCCLREGSFLPSGIQIFVRRTLQYCNVRKKLCKQACWGHVGVSQRDFLVSRRHDALGQLEGSGMRDRQSGKECKSDVKVLLHARALKRQFVPNEARFFAHANVRVLLHRKKNSRATEVQEVLQVKIARSKSLSDLCRNIPTCILESGPFSSIARHVLRKPTSEYRDTRFLFLRRHDAHSSLRQPGTRVAVLQRRITVLCAASPPTDSVRRKRSVPTMLFLAGQEHQL